MRIFPLLFLLVSAVPVHAADNPVVHRLLDHWNKSKDYMLRIAAQMPEAGYSSRPNAEEMTFGEQLLHIANDTEFLTQGLTTKKHPTFDAKHITKDSAMKALAASFDDGAQAIESLTDSDLNNKMVDAGGGKMTSLEVVIFAMDHIEHHRGQCIVYLRVKGIKPVDYVF
jgi:uncharacterized damage-inducible protein DinB